MFQAATARASIKKGLLKKALAEYKRFSIPSYKTGEEVKSSLTVLAEAADPEQMIPGLMESFIAKNAVCHHHLSVNSFLQHVLGVEAIIEKKSEEP